MSKKLLKSGAIVSIMTFVSRILGLVRDVVIANVMGAGVAADVFFFANKIPNFLRRLFAEGAFAQAFVPVLAEVQNENDQQSLRLFIARVAGTLGVIVTLVTILGVIGSPILVALFGTGWFWDYLNDGEQADKFVMASAMLKITFPYLWFVTLVGLSGAILNTLNKFAVAAFTPVLLNVVIIASVIYLSPYLEAPAFALAWGVFLGGLVQLLFQLPFLWRAGVLVKPRWGWKDEKVTKVRTLIIPALFGVSVGQINLLLDTVIASMLVTGSISWLYYSDRLMEFPLGLFGVAIATVILPTLSKNFVKNDQAQFQNNMDWALRMVMLLGVPAAVGLGLLAEELLLVIFQRGEFTNETAYLASLSLLAYAFGLLNFMLVKVLAPGFFSRQDTKTPVRFAIWSMISNMVFNIIWVLILGYDYGYIGLAIATAMSSFVNVALLYQRLHKDGVYRISRYSALFIVRIAIAVCAMAFVVIYLNKSQADWYAWQFEQRSIHLALLLGAAMLTYFTVLVTLGLRPRHLKSS
ncbi:MAG: murein biosynthesis integral membrane protein MurJ [Alteromonadaceae bacterium]|nr:murein biosynthesis integral membrane protein MurJ [Alteromonadaceae bacterium]